MIYPSGLNNSVRRSRYSRALAGIMSVVIATITSILIPSTAKARDEKPIPPKVLIFPFTNASTVTTDSEGTSLAIDVSSNVRLDIDALGYYKSTGFSVLNPSIQRALNVEGTIAIADLQSPTASPDRADKLAGIIGAPYFITANIDSVATDPTSGTVTVQLDGTFYNTATGAAIKQATVTGTGAPVSKDYDPNQLLSTAIANASGQLVAGLIAPRIVHTTVMPSAVPKQNVASEYGRGLLYALAIAFAAVIIHNHGGHSSSAPASSSTTTGGTTTTGPPPPPV